MTLNMYIQSGELVIIFRGDFKFKSSYVKSLRFCIILLILMVSMIPSYAIYGGIMKAYEARAVSLRTAEIQNQCTILSDQLNSYHYLSDTSSEVINANLTQLTNIYNGRIMIVDKELRVIKDTYGLDEGKIIVSEDVVRCMEGDSTNYYDADNRYIEITAPIMEGETKKISGVLLASVSTDTIVDSLNVLRSKGSTILGIVFIIMLGLSLFIAAKVVKPLRRITESIADVSEGYDDEVLHVNTFTETRQLSEAFNKMLGRLKQLDESREEFVSNVSHELKTPLTSMKVLADSLLAQQEVPVELYKEFMGDIAKEIDRENDIITDLLSLVKMDKTVKDMHIRTVNINELMEQILKRIKPLAGKKNVELVLESFRPVTAEIDEVKLSLAFSNLVENAVKYNQEDGWVHVTLNADHKYFYVKVVDSGIGIPEADQHHIFERFYRVDKSHSREMGGTGLGLAIARNAVIIHRGSIKVHSMEGEGTTFTVRIPLTHVA